VEYTKKIQNYVKLPFFLIPEDANKTGHWAEEVRHRYQMDGYKDV